jgi:hypothetical protein
LGGRSFTVGNFLEALGIRAADPIGIVKTWAGTMSGASVASSTWTVETPGAVSTSVALPSGKAITASSVTTRSTGAGLDDFRLSLGGVLHCHDHALGTGHEIHGTAHSGHHFPRDHPV